MPFRREKVAVTIEDLAREGSLRAKTLYLIDEGRAVSTYVFGVENSAYTVTMTDVQYRKIGSPEVDANVKGNVIVDALGL